MSDTIPGTRPTREGAEEVRSDKRTWTLPERQWVEYLLKKLQLYSSTDPDSCHASKLLNLGSLLKACGLELPAADPAVGCEPLKVKLADTSGPGTESGAPEIQREGGPTLTQRDGPATEPQEKAKKGYDPSTDEDGDQARWDASMARAEALQDRSDKAFEREQQLMNRMENLIWLAELHLAKLIARESGSATEADIKRTQELNKERGWEENKAKVGTIPTEQTGNPLIPSGATSSYPKLKREPEFTLGGYIPASQMPPEGYIWKTAPSHGKLKEQMTDGGFVPGLPDPEKLPLPGEKIIAKPEPTALDKASQRIRQLEQANEDQAAIIQDLHGQLASMENVNHKRRELGDRLIELAKDLEKWRNE